VGKDPFLNILILNGDLPVFPGWGGVEFLHTTRLAKLARKVGLVSLVHTKEQQEKTQALTDAGISLYLWKNPDLEDPSQAASGGSNRFRLLKIIGKLFYKIMCTRPQHPRDTVLQDLVFRNISSPLYQALGEDHWDVLMVVQSNRGRWLDYLPSFPVSVLVMHDVRALVYERQGKIAASWVERRACFLEAWLYRRFERKYCRLYDLIVTVSSADESWVRQHYQPSRLITIPIPVDSQYFSPDPDGQVAPARVLFSGMMNHPPNEDAACFFARQVFPHVKKTIPEAEFWIVGRDPTEKVQALAALPGVVVTGFVPDIRPSIREATLFVVPLRFGSGMRQKILEAWAMQKCVVSTSIGAEGIDYQNGANILIADDIPTLSARVIEAIRDPILRDRIRTGGRDRIIRQHNPESLSQKYFEKIACIAQEKREQVKPLRVIVDLRWMYPGVAGGIENLSRSFLNQLRQIDPYNQYEIFVPPEVRFDFDLRNESNFKIRALNDPKHDWRSLMLRGGEALIQRLQIGYWRPPELRALRKARLLNAEVAVSIPGYINPDLFPLKNVLVVPDIQHEYCPHFFLPQHLAERKKIYTDSIRRADHICAISEFTRQTLIDRLSIPPGKVTTTHLAADPMFHPRSRHRGKPEIVLKKYGLTAREYLLFPGNTWPHKNHRTALRAHSLLLDQYHLKPILVCTGAAKEAHPDLLQIIQDLRLQDQVKFLGYCPTADMPALYEGAAALFFPSLFEGFGIPVLEAMWCDCPVVCSNTTSLPEIVGDAGILVDPLSPEEQAAALSRLLTDSELRRALVERGRIRAPQFSWRNFTMTLVRIISETKNAH
jgi:glycosyltransferase involved in cell wall biosynthesis